MDLLWGRGRAGRLQHLLVSAATVLATVVAVAAWTDTHQLTGQRTIGLPAYVAVGLALWIQSANVVRRLHDRGHTGLWLFGLFVPVVGIGLALYLLVAPSDPGWNRYGTPPVDVGHPMTAHQRLAHHAAVDEAAAHRAHDRQFLDDDGSFDMDGLYRNSDIERR